MRSCTDLCRRVLVAEQDAPGGREIEPGDQAQQRRLAGARRAEQRDQLAAGDVERNAVQRRRVAECLGEILDVTLMGSPRSLSPATSATTRGRRVSIIEFVRYFASAVIVAPYRRAAESSSPKRHSRIDLTTSVTSASSASSEATANAAGPLIVVVENLDMQRHRVGLAADVAGHDRHRAELAHRARVAEQHAVHQAPLHVRQRDAPERLPAARAERDRGFLLLRPLLLHQRDQLARDERERDEDRRQHDARHGEDDLEAVALQPRPEIALGAEQDHVDQAGDDGRDRERQVDQRDQERLAAELELGDRPGGGNAEHEIGRHGDRRDQQRELDGGDRVRVGERGEIGADAAAQRLDEHDDQRKHQKQPEEQQRDGDQDALDRDAALGASARRRSSGGAAQCERQTSPNLLRAQAWIRLMVRNMTNEIASIIVAIAVAPE